MSGIYLDAIRELVHESTYNRGLKYYLDGKIDGWDEALLPDWRVYKVSGGDVYRVKAPLVHKLVDKIDSETTLSVLEGYMSCNCQYYEDKHGYCKHMVSVCASLDDEFYRKNNAFNDSTQLEGYLDNFMETEKTKQGDKWLEKVRYYLELHEDDENEAYVYNKIYNSITGGFARPDENSEYIDSLQGLLVTSCKKYYREKRVVKLLSDTRFWFYATDTWWKFCYPILDHIEGDNLVDCLANFWLIIDRYPEYYGAVKVDMLDVIKTQEESVKTGIFNNILVEYRQTALDFALEFELSDVIIEHQDTMDIKTLIKSAKYTPDNVDAIEQRLLNELRSWSDFLTSDGYDALVDVVTLWRSDIGETSVLSELVEYIKSNHARKKKLIKALT